MAYEKGNRSGMRRRGGRSRRKVCVFCGENNNIDYKDVATLRRSTWPARLAGSSSQSHFTIDIGSTSADVFTQSDVQVAHLRYVHTIW